MANEERKTQIATQVAEAAELGRRIALCEGKSHVADDVLDAAPYVILRDAQGNERVQSLGDLRLSPPHRKLGTVHLHDAESFISYYMTHGNGAPVYATMSPAAFVAVLNDHTAATAGWRDHRASFKVGHSTEWSTWTANSGAVKKFDSTESFAAFIEDNAPDILSPSPSDMLAMAVNFRVNENATFSKAIRLNDGHTELQYDAIVSASAGGKGSGAIEIPEVFQILLPVFQGMQAKQYELYARFRYRLREGKLTIWYELIRPHKVIEQAFRDLWKQIADATGAPILHGTPG